MLLVSSGLIFLILSWTAWSFTSLRTKANKCGSTYWGNFGLVVVGELHAHFLCFRLACFLYSLAPPGFNQWMPSVPSFLLNGLLIVLCGQITSKTLWKIFRHQYKIKSWLFLITSEPLVYYRSIKVTQNPNSQREKDLDRLLKKTIKLCICFLHFNSFGCSAYGELLYSQRPNIKELTMSLTSSHLNRNVH